MDTPVVDRSILKLPFAAGDNPDIDDLMFHACFVLLGDYVETELGLLTTPCAADQHHNGYRVWSLDGFDQEAIDLWLWYCRDLPALETLPDSGPWRVDGIKNSKLMLLMEIRRKLWT